MNTASRNDVVHLFPTATSPPQSDDTFYVYIMASADGEMLAVSMSQDIVTRVRNQKDDLHPRDYTSVHAIHTLVKVEEYDDLCEAIERYNRLRAMEMESLRNIVSTHNPSWTDLFTRHLD